MDAMVDFLMEFLLTSKYKELFHIMVILIGVGSMAKSFHAEVSQFIKILAFISLTGDKFQKGIADLLKIIFKNFLYQ